MRNYFPFSCITSSRYYEASPYLQLPEANERKRHGCRWCCKRFHKKNDLTRHIRKHTGEKPYMCHVCKRCFSVKSNMMKHVRLHAERPFYCQMCLRTYAVEEEYKQHVCTAFISGVLREQYMWYSSLWICCMLIIKQKSVCSILVHMLLPING